VIPRAVLLHLAGLATRPTIDRLILARSSRLAVSRGHHHERLAQAIPPPAKLGLALAQDRANESLKSLCESGVWDVAFVLVEFSLREQPTRQHQHLLQLVHHRRLADPRITGHEHEFGCAIGYDAVEGSEQRVDRSGTSYAPSGNSSMRPVASHSARQRLKSLSRPAAV
jgi:hypothetical protein